MTTDDSVRVENALAGRHPALFPTALRTSGLSLTNAFTQMTLGRTAPFISLWLIQATGHPVAPAFYLMFGAAISVVALAVLRRKTDQSDFHSH